MSAAGAAVPPTIATVWAHYDDDLIFANPTVGDAIAAGSCVRSLFLTASDAGKGLGDYATERELGIRAAYDVMLGGPRRWSDRAETLPGGVTVTVTAPDDDERVALSFLRLPDGGLSGNGWFTTGYETLARLLRGEIPTIRALDSGQELTAERLVEAVAGFVETSGASAVIANLPGWVPGAQDDHPDHGSTGHLVAAAVDAGSIDGRIVRYATGYPGAGRPTNLSPEVVERKLEVFAAYGAHDSVLARESPADYLTVPKFGEWLQREYLVADAEVARPA